MTTHSRPLSGRWLVYTPPLLLAALVFFNVLLWRRAVEGRVQLRQIERVRILTVRALSDLQDAETGQRGYLISGTSDFLGPYVAGKDSVFRHLFQLKWLTREEEAQQRYLRDMEPIVRYRIARLDSGVQMRRAGIPLDSILKILPPRKGKVLMDSARTLFGAMWRVENRVFDRREQRERADQKLLIYALMIGTVLSGLASLYVGHKLANDATHHWLMSAELRARIGMLESQVRDSYKTPEERHRDSGSTTI